MYSKVFYFEGFPVAALPFDGAVGFLARQIGHALGAEGEGADLVRKLRSDWVPHLPPDTHILRPRREVLSAVKNAVPAEDTAIRAAQLLILTEEGLDKVLRLQGGATAVRMRSWLDNAVLPPLYASPHFPLLTRSATVISAATVVRRVAELLQELQPGDAETGIMQLLQAELIGGQALPDRRANVRARLQEAVVIRGERR